MDINLNFSAQIIAAKEKKTLNKPFRTPKGPKKFGVYVNDDTVDFLSKTKSRLLVLDTE